MNMETKSENIITQTKTAKYWLLENEIVYAKVNEGAEQSLEHARENLKAIYKTAGNKIAPVLIDIRYAKSISAEARAHYAGEEGARVQAACALLIDNPISKVIGNFFLKLNNPPMPTKLFTNEDKALDWLINNFR